MGKTSVTNRKVRSDKKKEIRPTVPIYLTELLSRISYITSNPIKDVAETILKEGLSNHLVMECMSDQFKRDYWFGQTLFLGKDEFSSSRIRRIEGEKGRVSFRLVKQDVETLADLAYSLNLTENSTAGLVLEIASYETNIIHHYLNLCVTANLDLNRRKQLKILLNEIRKFSSSAPNDLDFIWLLNYIADGSKNIKQNIEEFLDQHFSKK